MPAEMTDRRFPPPWSVDEHDECFIVRDVNGQALWPASTSRRSRADGRRTSSPATRPGASLPTSQGRPTPHRPACVP